MPKKQRKKIYSYEEKSLILNSYFEQDISLTKLAETYCVSRCTISLWLKNIDYDLGNLARLKPNPKEKKEKGMVRGNVLSEENRREIDKLLKENPNWSCLKIKEYFFRHYQKVLNTKSVYYYLKESGVIEARRKAQKQAETKRAHDRRFEYDAPMKAVQCDTLQLTLAGGQKVYLVTFIDDFSRFVLSSRIIPAKTMDGVLKCFTETVREHGPMEFLITDQGSEFVSWKKFTRFEETLVDWGVELIASGPHTPQNQGKIERWHKTFREDFEQIYGPFTTLVEAQQALMRFICFYNFERPHQGIGGMVPADRFFEMDDQLHRAMQFCRKSDDRIYFSCNINGHKMVVCGPRHGDVKFFLNGEMLENEQQKADTAG